MIPPVVTNFIGQCPIPVHLPVQKGVFWLQSVIQHVQLAIQLAKAVQEEHKAPIVIVVTRLDQLHTSIQ